MLCITPLMRALVAVWVSTPALAVAPTSLAEPAPAASSAATRAAASAPAASTAPTPRAAALPAHTNSATRTERRVDDVAATVTVSTGSRSMRRGARPMCSGWRLFDDAALQQVRGCRFDPATQAGQPVESWVEFAVRFALVG